MTKDAARTAERLQRQIDETQRLKLSREQIFANLPALTISVEIKGSRGEQNGRGFEFHHNLLAEFVRVRLLDFVDEQIVAQEQIAAATLALLNEQMTPRKPLAAEEPDAAAAE